MTHPSLLATRRYVLAAGLLGAATHALPSLAADAWPTKPVRFIVPFPPGGPVDTTTRLASQKLADIWKVAAVIDNRAGAGGNIGGDALAKSPLLPRASRRTATRFSWAPSTTRSTRR